MFITNLCEFENVLILNLKIQKKTKTPTEKAKSVHKTHTTHTHHFTEFPF